MSESVYGRPTKPSKCAWILGLPATKDEFYASQSRPTSEYTKRFWHWPEYRREFLEDYEPLRELLVTLGVHLIENASVKDFNDVWRSEFDAVVLFAHWAEDGVEFRDGKVGIGEVASSIPSERLATLDLCVCHPQALVLLLESSRPLLIKKAIWRISDPKFWCMFYTALFRYLAVNEKSYPEALDEIASILLAKASKGEKH
jgi:hypothetical protein